MSLLWLVVAWGLGSFLALKNKEGLLRPECRGSLFGWAYVVGGSVLLAILLLNLADRTSEQRRYHHTPDPYEIQNLGWRQN